MNSFEYLLPSSYKEEVLDWLHEDCSNFDIGGFVVGDKIDTAELLCKQSCILAGVPFVNAILRSLNLQVQWGIVEGSAIEIATSMPVVVATVTGTSKDILLAERTCLNILSRASGVATMARKHVKIKELHNWHGYIAGTRKTTPGFRMVEKYALVVGGAATHRMDLSHMVMLKDNHIWSTGSISNAVVKTKSVAGFASKIEVISFSEISFLTTAYGGNGDTG
jgi:nicotinate-nucleotide pyrophosphorylase (carboxylating)